MKFVNLLMIDGESWSGFVSIRLGNFIDGLNNTLSINKSAIVGRANEFLASILVNPVKESIFVFFPKISDDGFQIQFGACLDHLVDGVIGTHGLSRQAQYKALHKLNEQIFQHSLFSVDLPERVIRSPIPGWIYFSYDFGDGKDITEDDLYTRCSWMFVGELKEELQKILIALEA